MADNNSHIPADTLKKAVSETVEQGQDIRARVRDLTLQALKTRHLNSTEIKGVIRTVAEGISLGAEKRAGEVRSALSEALGGLDDALRKSAEATSLALRQLTSQTKDFTDQELKQALEHLKTLEDDFLSTVGQVAEAAGARIKGELKDLVTHAQRVGTGTGSQVAATVNEFGHRVSISLKEGAAAGKDAAREVSVRLAALASGLLAGMADALREKTEKNKQAK
jgi:hypothetical protein